MNCAHCGRPIHQGWKAIWQHDDGLAICHLGDEYALDPDDIEFATPSALAD